MKKILILVLYSFSLLGCTAEQDKVSERDAQNVILGALNNDKSIISSGVTVYQGGESIQLSEVRSRKLLTLFKLPDDVESTEGRRQTLHSKIKITTPDGISVMVRVYRLGEDVVWVSGEEFDFQAFISISFLDFLNKSIQSDKGNVSGYGGDNLSDRQFMKKAYCGKRFTVIGLLYVKSAFTSPLGR